MDKRFKIIFSGYEPPFEKNGKLKIEILMASILYTVLFIIWHGPVAWKVEWTWEAIQIAFSLIATIALGRSLKTMGLKSDNLNYEAKIGLLSGVILTGILLIPLLKWNPPLVGRFYNLSQLGYIFLLFSGNVVATEFFYRGYIQPRLETLTGTKFGLLIASILAGFDLLELTIFNIYIATGMALVFGLLYIKTRSLVATMTAHFTFMTLIIVLTAAI